MHDVNKSLSLTITSEGFVLYFRSFIWECTPVKRSFFFFRLCRIPLWTAPPLESAFQSCSWCRVNLPPLLLLPQGERVTQPATGPHLQRPWFVQGLGVWSQLAGWWEHSLGFWQSAETMPSFSWGNRVVRILSRAAGGYLCYRMEKACLKMKLVQRKQKWDEKSHVNLLIWPHLKSVRLLNISVEWAHFLTSI